MPNVSELYFNERIAAESRTAPSKACVGVDLEG